jgi:fatty-acyl-CoA synthase
MKILEGYGLTEGTTASSVNPPHGERRVGSIGMRLPYSQMEIFVRGAGKSRLAETNEIGNICIKGPTVFNGYLEESKNEGIWAEEGWFDTGDLGRKDADGYFWLTGRAKDLIIRGGHNIDPAAIEDPLYKLDGVVVAAAVGRPDAHAGEVPVAYVQLKPDCKLTSQAIMEYLEGEIGEKAALPKEIFILDDIPLTPIGKIFKPSLRWDAVRHVYEQEIRQMGTDISDVSVKVREDKLHGILALIEVKAGENASAEEINEKIGEVLSRFTVKYELSVI